MSCRVLDTDKCIITNSFANHQSRVRGKQHIYGVDIVGKGYSICDVIAHTDGTVRKVINYIKGHESDKQGMGFGNQVIIEHKNRVLTIYNHLEPGSIKVEVGDRVVKGQKIARMGDTGSSNGVHLDFSVIQLKKGCVWKDNINLVTDVGLFFGYANPEWYLYNDFIGEYNDEEFIDFWGKKAVERYNETKILPSLVICQAYLESGKGSTDKAVCLQNYHGIKWYNDEVCRPYESVNMATWEVYNGQKIDVNSLFCLFDNVDQELDCYYNWLNRANSNYKALHGCTDAMKCFDLINASPYATDPDYGAKLKNIYQRMPKIAEYDKQVIEVPVATSTEKKYYRVQVGAYNSLILARLFKLEVSRKLGVNAILKKYNVKDCPIKVQAYAFESKENALKCLENVKKIFPKAFITEQNGIDIQ